jgi:hypothetical protein
MKRHLGVWLAGGLVLLASLGASAQPPTRSIAAAPAPSPGWPASVPRLEGVTLTGPEPMASIYLGRFERVPRTDSSRLTNVSSNGLAGRRMFANYVEEFSRSCARSLPADARTVRVPEGGDEAARQACYQDPLCVPPPRRNTADSGIRVAPEFYDRYVAVLDAGPSLYDLFAENRNLAEVGPQMLRDVQRMNQIIVRNGCNSPQVKRLGQNLHAYASDRPPAQAFDAFGQSCRAQIASIMPGKTAAACACLRTAFSRQLSPAQYASLEDNFTEASFLSSAFRKVGLRQEVAACLR